MAFGHGYNKFLKLISGAEVSFPSLFGMPSTLGLALATFAEFIACLFIIVGLKTRLFCIPVIITMTIAAFYVHADHAWFMQSTDGPAKEPAMLYLFAFISIYILGPGKYSLDDKFSFGVI